MKEGYWVNYESGRAHELNWGESHEVVIRSKDIARRLGVPDEVFQSFSKYRVEAERCRFLFRLMERVPLLRVRGHGGLYNTFQFCAQSRRRKEQAYRAIRKLARTMPPTKLLNIVNLTGENEQVFALLFLKRFKKGKRRAR